MSQHGLAPPLLARFQNGLLYRFIRGQVCTPADLVRERVWRGIAARLAEWHAVMPIIDIFGHAGVLHRGEQIPLELSDENATLTSGPINGDMSRTALKKPAPNMWTVMQKWVHALPESSPKEAERKAILQKEVDRVTEELIDVCGLGTQGVSCSSMGHHLTRMRH